MATPHRCPVCNGVGTVPPGFYEGNHSGTSISTQRATCKACGGSGLVWDYHSAPLPQPLPYPEPIGPNSPWKIPVGPMCSGGEYIPKQSKGIMFNS